MAHVNDETIAAETEVDKYSNYSEDPDHISTGTKAEKEVHPKSAREYSTLIHLA